MFKKLYRWIRLRLKRKATISFQPQINISTPPDIQQFARDMEKLRDMERMRGPKLPPFRGNVTTSRSTMRGHTHQSVIDPLNPANPSSPINQIETYNHHSVGSCGSHSSHDSGSYDSGSSSGSSSCD